MYLDTVLLILTCTVNVNPYKHYICQRILVID